MKRRAVLANAGVVAVALAGCTAGGDESDDTGDGDGSSDGESGETADGEPDETTDEEPDGTFDGGFDGWSLFTYEVPGEYQYEFIGDGGSAVLSLTVGDGTVDAWISDGRERIYEGTHTGTPDIVEAELGETPIGEYLEELWYREEISSITPGDLEEGATWTDETDDGELTFEVNGPGSWGKNADVETYNLLATRADGDRDHFVKFAPAEGLVIDATYYENDEIDTKVYIYQLYD